MNFFLLPLTLFSLSASVLLPHFHTWQSHFVPLIGGLTFWCTRLCRSAVPGFAYPALTPGEPGGHHAIFKTCSYPETGFELASLFTPGSWESPASSPEKGNHQLVSPKLPNREGVHSVSPLMESRSEQLWNGKVLWYPLPSDTLWSRTLLVRLLSCSGSKAENPSRRSACPSETPEDEVKGQEPVTQNWSALLPKKCSLTSSWPSGFYKLRERELQNC